MLLTTNSIHASKQKSNSLAGLWKSTSCFDKITVFTGTVQLGFTSNMVTSLNFFQNYTHDPW